MDLGLPYAAFKSASISAGSEPPMLAQYKRGAVLVPNLPMAGMTNHIRPKEKKGEGAALPLGQPN
ncbi:hypothetical protein DS901_16580 [Loktanella sp. D2R18]|nr:hypothetical protein DS901_16580 [Loktanella sp. D2R18]